MLPDMRRRSITLDKMLRSWAFSCLALGVAGVRCSAPSGPWDAFNFAPSSRTVKPVSIFKAEGAVENGGGLTTTGSGKATFQSGAWLTLDFGKEVSVLYASAF